MALLCNYDIRPSCSSTWIFNLQLSDSGCLDKHMEPEHDRGRRSRQHWFRVDCVCLLNVSGASVDAEIYCKINNLYRVIQGGLKGIMCIHYIIVIYHFFSQTEAYCQPWPPPPRLAPFPFWHSSWWAVIHPVAELTASVRLEQQTVTGTNLQLKKKKRWNSA